MLYIGNWRSLIILFLILKQIYIYWTVHNRYKQKRSLCKSKIYHMVDWTVPCDEIWVQEKQFLLIFCCVLKQHFPHNGYKSCITPGYFCSKVYTHFWLSNWKLSYLTRWNLQQWLSSDLKGEAKNILLAYKYIGSGSILIVHCRLEILCLSKIQTFLSDLGLELV